MAASSEQQRIRELEGIVVTHKALIQGIVILLRFVRREAVLDFDGRCPLVVVAFAPAQLLNGSRGFSTGLSHTKVGGPCQSVPVCGGREAVSTKVIPCTCVHVGGLVALNTAALSVGVLCRGRSLPFA